jgi:hypothetical protein
MDNPSAFPNSGNSEWGQRPRDGMSLRDYFAGQAMSGLTGALGRVQRIGQETQAQADARWCGERADAMLAERERREKDNG